MKQEQKEHIAKLLESRTHDIFDAVDCRNFDPDSPIWSYLANDIVIETELFGQLEKQTKETWLEYLRGLFTENPDMRNHITSMETKVGENAAWAETFSTLETTGIAMIPGVKKDTLAIYTWRKLNGRWVIVKTKSISGLDHANYVP